MRDAVESSVVGTQGERRARTQRRGGLEATVRTLEAARGRAQPFWRAFNETVVPMIVVDNERRHLAANGAARLVFRLSRRDLLARRIDDFTPPHRLGTMFDLWRRLMREGSLTSPYLAGFPDGSELVIQLSALTNILPGQHVIVFTPASWPEDELASPEDRRGAALIGPLPVSPREREVLNLIATGADLQTVADELTISVTTVRTHVRNALRKLGAKNRAHAVALAMQHGLIGRKSPDRIRRASTL